MAKQGPTAAFVLVLIGGILTLIGGIVVAAIGASLFSLVALGAVGGLIGVVGILSGIIMIVASFMIRSGNASSIRMWSVIALVFTIIGLANGGGFIIGFVLGLVGSILGLAYKK